jgi:integrase
MTILMPTLGRAPNGDHFCRKVIPADVRAAYAAAYGVKHEERFRYSAGAPVAEAKRAWAEWLADVEGRIAALRSAAVGRPVTLSHRELHAIASRWYLWFTAQHEEEPGTFEQWQHTSDEMRDVWESGFSGTGDPERGDEEIGRGHRRRIRAKLTELSRIQTFLASEGLNISAESTEALLDGPLRAEFGAALTRLMRASRGDYRADAHAADAEQVARLKSPTGKKLAGWNAWEAFSAYVAERKPANSTINRWRSIFLDLDTHFERKDVALYTGDDAVAWKDTLIGQERVSRTVNDVWLTAARTVFQWVVDQKKIGVNPFHRVKAAGPKVKPTKGEFAEEAIEIILAATVRPQASNESAKLKAAKRWVPWLSAYSGSRPGEMTQLRREDIRKHRSGCWTLSITPDAGTVKGSVPRTIVLHDHLIEQGFIDFVKNAPEGPLFYEPASERPMRDPLNPPRPASVVLRNKLAAWVRSLGVEDKGYAPGHSWRHTFARRAARAGIEERLRNAFCGWVDTRAKRVYETPTIEDLADAIARFPRYQVEVA